MVMDKRRAPREIAAQRLLLHSFRAEDAEQVLEAVDESREEIGRWMSWPPDLTEAGTSRQEARHSRERWEAGTSFDYTMRRCPPFRLAHRIRAAEQGNGYVSEAVRAVTRMAFAALGARRLEISCDERNTRSVRVAEACGFRYEGRMRHDDRLANGELSNGRYYSLIDTDEAVHQPLAKPEPA